MKVKFNNIRDLTDARYAAANGAEWIGFSIGSPDSLAPAKIQEILGWCAGPVVVLEIAENLPAESILNFLDVIETDCLEAFEADYHRLITAPGFKNRDWIVKTGSEIPFTVKGWRHKPLRRVSEAEEDAMYNVDHCSLEDVKEHLPGMKAISLSCFESQVNGEKDYSHWNELFDFFEEL